MKVIAGTEGEEHLDLDACVLRPPRGEPTRHRDKRTRVFEMDGPPDHLRTGRSPGENWACEIAERAARGTYAGTTPVWRVARAEEGCTDSPRRSDVRCSVSTCVVHRRENTRGVGKKSLERMRRIGKEEGQRITGGSGGMEGRHVQSVRTLSVVHWEKTWREKMDKTERVKEERSEKAGRVTVR